MALARAHRAGEEYPTAEQLLANLPVVIRALCDHVLLAEETALDVAYRLASIIVAIEGCRGKPVLKVAGANPYRLAGHTDPAAFWR